MRGKREEYRGNERESKRKRDSDRGGEKKRNRIQ